MRPLLLTSGEPAGIGPDLCLQIALREAEGTQPWVVLADRELLAQRAALLGLHVRLIDWLPGSEAAATGAGSTSGTCRCARRSRQENWTPPIAPMSLRC